MKTIIPDTFWRNIEIALEGIWYEDNHTRYLLAQFQFLRISYSLKASAEERAVLSLLRAVPRRNTRGLCSQGT
jgi:hypothetical protein